MVEQILIAFCTFPDPNTARKVANEIIDLRLAACGNILSPIHSIYRWKGKLESSEETLVMLISKPSSAPFIPTKCRRSFPLRLKAGCQTIYSGWRRAVLLNGECVVFWRAQRWSRRSHSR